MRALGLYLFLFTSCLCVAWGSYIFESQITGTDSTDTNALYNACLTPPNHDVRGTMDMVELSKHLRLFRRRFTKPRGPDAIKHFLQIVNETEPGGRTVAAWVEYSILRKQWVTTAAGGTRTRYDGVVGRIDYLCVHPNFRGQTYDGFRLGRELLLRLNEVLKLRVDTRVPNTASFWGLNAVEAATTFYRANGFVERESSSWPHPHFLFFGAENMRGPLLQNRCAVGSAEIVGSAPPVCCPGTPTRLAQCRLVAATNTMSSSELFTWPSTLPAPVADVFSCGPCLRVVVTYPTRRIPNLVLQLHGTEKWEDVRQQIAPLASEVVNVNGGPDYFDHNRTVGKVALAYPLAVNVV